MTRSGFAAALLASVAIAPANADERAAVEAQIEALQARFGALEARRARARVTAAAAVERVTGHVRERVASGWELRGSR